MLRICVAFLQSASSCASSGGLIVLSSYHIDCNCAVFPQCDSWCAFSGWQDHYTNSCIDCIRAVFPRCASLYAFWGGRPVAWKVALCALVWLLFSMNEDMFPQVAIRAKWLVTMWAIVILNPTVCLFVIDKAFFTFKRLRTQVARDLLGHLQSVPSSVCLRWLRQIM